MQEYYNQNYTRQQISVILQSIHDCVRNKRYLISQNENRKENIEFIIEYNLTSSKQKEILLAVALEDFCYQLQNIKKGFEHETLYVFCRQFKLYNMDDELKLLDIYVKFIILNYIKGKQCTAISFHPSNKPITYLFR